jgi:hypothetical protein
MNIVWDRGKERQGDREKGREGEGKGEGVMKIRNRENRNSK